MWAIKRNGKTILTTEEKPKFINGTLRHPVKAVDVLEAEVEVIEAGMTLEQLKENKKSDIKQAFVKDSEKPIVDTGLGFSVDGGYQNKQDFEVAKKYAFPMCKASDNTFHPVTASDYDTIIFAIEMNGIALYQRKWELEGLIESATTIEELEAVQW